MITAEQKQFWNDNGFLVVPGFISAQETEAVNRLVDTTWEDRPANVVVDDMVTDRRSFIRDVSAKDQREHRFKVNDLYLDSEELRGLCLDRRITDILADLLGDAPVLCNTLNFAQGSAQDDHIDSLYMTPLNPGNLLATWIALEDTHADAGPLRYYPGSHRFPLFRFSDGTHHAIPEEMPAWSAHARAQVAQAGIEPQEFLARRGDLFIWHANLLHGGGKIRSKELTRKSLVSHYFTLGDCRQQRLDTVPHGDSFWYRRDPQPVHTSRLKKTLGPTVRRLRRLLQAGSTARA